MASIGKIRDICDANRTLVHSGTIEFLNAKIINIAHKYVARGNLPQHPIRTRNGCYLCRLHP